MKLTGKTFGKPLSPQEERILRLLADGNVTKQIASALHLSSNTISTYLNRAKQKLGARTTLQAAIIWIRRVDTADREYLSWVSALGVRV